MFSLTNQIIPSSTHKLYHLQIIFFIFEIRHSKAQHKNNTGLFHQFKVSFTEENCVILSLFDNMLTCRKHINMFSKNPAKQWNAVYGTRGALDQSEAIDFPSWAHFLLWGPSSSSTMNWIPTTISQSHKFNK